MTPSSQSNFDDVPPTILLHSHSRLLKWLQVTAFLSWALFGFGAFLVSLNLVGWHVEFQPWVTVVLFGPSSLWCFVAAWVLHKLKHSAQVSISESRGRTEMIPIPKSDSRNTVIAVGRAYLHMITSANVLLERKPFWTEALLLKLVKVLYTHRLKGLLELLSEDMVAEILAEQDENGVLVPFSSN